LPVSSRALHATLLLLIPLPLVASRAAAQQPCLSDTLAARWESQIITNQFTAPDSTSRQRIGLPSTIRSVTWVRDPTVCAEASRRLKLVRDSLEWGGYGTRAQTRVLVFAVEPELYVVVDEGDLDRISFFSRHWQYIVSLAMAH
jgi:hypothetical protein